MWSDDRACRSLGITLEDVGPGHARLSMRVRDDMVNGHGTCHGGFIFALADTAFGYACNARNERSVAQHCSITFLRPGRLGQMLVATAEERARAGRSGIYDIVVCSADGTVIAEFRGHSRGLGEKFFPG
ncbi:hydroxyphenylacetyl-CoA thioesterase PaaI [Rhodovastum atsumiense]|uniref:Hydroxyphenylacetyl-CoA thioesterase PaaI n=2 Tax=Rhodovastum atsumiense TaxID=504468 RepID=A0A5M6IMQ9_9PROT|nr:hydroxyphenylacetyl-CoA thioesterase PaaI [Rhodovastum atsumiense]